MVKIFNGQQLAQKKEKKLQKKVEAFKKKFRVSPKLVSLLIGDDKTSHLYLALKEKAAQRVGILFEKKTFPAGVDKKEVYQALNNLNRDKKVQGIIIQMPLPKKLDPFWLVSKIDPEKDVDCLTPENLGLLTLGRPIFLPATVRAVVEIIKNSSLKIKGKKVVVVGAGNLVGKPLALHLKNLGATVVVVDEYTQDLKEWTKQGEVLISATGVPNLIKKEMVKKGVVVIDVGAPKAEIDNGVREIASLVTPVPGGVGPLTVVYLLENLFLATQSQVASVEASVVK
jgi:methylenetetrahydrofolate dehydrogenase (NADP+)/methenyltetrahydrofolate cyclohydrolase